MFFACPIRLPFCVSAQGFTHLVPLCLGAALMQGLIGGSQRVCCIEVAADGHKLVAHTKNYVQVC